MQVKLIMSKIERKDTRFMKNTPLFEKYLLSSYVYKIANLPKKKQ